MNAHQANRYTQFITPLGGIIALACFFLPWTEMDGRISATTSGFAWIKHRPLIGIALIASVTITCLSPYVTIQRTPWKFKMPILIGSGIGISTLFQEYLYFVAFQDEIRLFIGKFSFWGTITGFVVAAVGVFLTRSKEVEERSVMFVDEQRVWFIAHAAAIGVLACFFLSWEGIGAISSVSGFDLAKRHLLIRIALIATIIIVGINFYMLWRQTLWKSKGPIFIGSGIGLGVLFSHYINYFYTYNIVNKTGTQISAHTLEFGLWGTVIGYVIAAVGMSLISTKNKNKQVENTGG